MPIMSSVITVAEAQAKLKELITSLAPGEEIVITENQRPVAKLVGQPSQQRKPRKAGSAKGKLIILQEDDEHLKDFEDYMQ
jgi:prevent-host-death family protein